MADAEDLKMKEEEETTTKLHEEEEGAEQSNVVTMKDQSSHDDADDKTNVTTKDEDMPPATKEEETGNTDEKNITANEEVTKDEGANAAVEVSSTNQGTEVVEKVDEAVTVEETSNVEKAKETDDNKEVAMKTEEVEAVKDTTTDASAMATASVDSPAPIAGGMADVTEAVTEAPMPVDAVKPADDDVLFGRGKPFQNHPGNRKMLELIDKYKVQYNESPRDRKRPIVEEIIGILSQNGGRFLRRYNEDVNSTWWTPVTKQVAFDKVSHAFRSRGRPKSEKVLPPPTAAAGNSAMSNAQAAAMGMGNMGYTPSAAAFQHHMMAAAAMGRGGAAAASAMMNPSLMGRFPGMGGMSGLAMGGGGGSGGPNVGPGGMSLGGMGGGGPQSSSQHQQDFQHQFHNEFMEQHRAMAAAAAAQHQAALYGYGGGGASFGIPGGMAAGRPPIMRGGGAPDQGGDAPSSDPARAPGPSNGGGAPGGHPGPSPPGPVDSIEASHLQQQQRRQEAVRGGTAPGPYPAYMQ